VLPIYDGLYDTPEISHFLVRHEQAAASMAAAYAQVATGMPAMPGPIVSDPIIAAIAEHRRLDDKQYEMWCTLQEQDYESVTLESAQERVSDAAHKAAWALTKIKPTTAVGAVALFGYVLADVQLKHGDWHLQALSNATAAAKQTEHADADLFDLGNKIITAARDACYASPRHDKAEEAEASWQSQNPQPDDESAFSKWCEQLSAVKLECQYDEATAAWNDACDAIFRLTAEIADYVAGSADGVEIKRLIVASYQDSSTVSLDVEDAITDSIRRDLKHVQRMRSAA
jgi:hypothetical protein